MLIQKVADLANNTAPTFAAPASSDTAPIGSVLAVTNGSASSITVTITGQGKVSSGDAYPNHVVTVAAAATKWIPVIGAYLDPTNGVADVAFSATASVTAGCFVIAQ